MEEMTLSGPASFWDKYLRFFTNDDGTISPTYFVQLYALTPGSSTSCWVSTIYNLLSGQWENRTGSGWCGASQQNKLVGWTWWEPNDSNQADGRWTHLNNVCPDLNSVDAQALKKYTLTGQWVSTIASDLTIISPSQTSCWFNNIYLMEKHGTQSWHAHTPLSGNP
jgi:hypothetical protein